jgi:hypothetical protein
MVKVAALRVCHRNVRILSSFVHGDQAGERIPRISFSEEKRVFQNLSIPLLAHTRSRNNYPLGYDVDCGEAQAIIASSASPLVAVVEPCGCLTVPRGTLPTRSS